jgi:RNA polymerase sigma-70 factor (ECF subfamily)
MELANEAEMTWPHAAQTMNPMAPAIEAALVENHRAFLRFLVRRVGGMDAAEEVLQQFYLRAVSKAAGLRQSESVIAWLYRLLRTTLVDHYRRETARQRRESDYAQLEILSNQDRDVEMEKAICTCFEALLPTLKPDYAEILLRVDLRGAAPRQVAQDMGLDPNNVRVRLHRARQAMKSSLLQSCKSCTKQCTNDCDCG